ncbi:MAG: hypothetical protein AB7J28_08230 [Hyphomonadaceae bacterium]
MFERATASLIAMAAVCAASAMAIFATGFALYALLLQWLTPAGSAACVAVFAALIAVGAAWYAKDRAERKRLEAEAEQAHAMAAMPSELSGFLADRPIATLAVSLIGGILAARNPGLVRDVLNALRAYGGR